jgi:glycerol-3-phosphate dehydrogenase
MYDIFAGREALESSYFLTRSKALEAFPMLKKDELVGALVYYDGKNCFNMIRRCKKRL